MKVEFHWIHYTRIFRRKMDSIRASSSGEEVYHPFCSPSTCSISNSVCKSLVRAKVPFTVFYRVSSSDEFRLAKAFSGFCVVLPILIRLLSVACAK